MDTSYEIIDADGHIVEPPHLWHEYIDPKFRRDAPALVDRSDEGLWWAAAGELFGRTVGGGRGARAGGHDPHARILDMELDAIDAAFLYPSAGLYFAGIHDADLAAAICRAYNRWLADYCSPYPDRLFGVAMLPAQTVEAAIAELRFARNDLGMRAGTIRPNPYGGRVLHSRENDALWAEAQDLDFGIGLHAGSRWSGMVQLGADRFESEGARHIVTHTFEMMAAAVSLIWGGVCDRYPRIRFAFLESGGGWMAPWLDRMDRHFDDLHNDSQLTMRPSDLFRRNCWISFEPVERTLSVLAQYLGPSRVLWATDYPHGDGFFPGAPKMISDLLRDAPEAKRDVLSGGARGFYGL